MRNPRRFCRTTFLTAVVLIAVAGLAPAAALADDTSLGAYGGTVVARPAAGVRLAGETVQAVCFGSFAEFRIDFRFVNDGGARTVRLGFPFAQAYSGEHGSERPFGFQAWQGTKPLEVKVVRSGPRYAGHGYYAHTARFPHGETMVTVSYLAQQSGTARTRTGQGFSSGMAAWYEYWLHSGRTWQGPIGAAVVRFSLADTFQGKGLGLTAAEADDGVPVTTPGWTQPLPRTFQWRRDTFEPQAARGREWWEGQTASDVFLGFGRDFRRPSRVKWASSDGTTSFAGDGGAEAAGDGQLNSSWTASLPGDDVHPWIEARFPRPREIRELRIVSGNGAYLTAFRRYGRPRTVTATFSGGDSVRLRLADAPVLQRFPVHVTTGSVRLTVDEAYPGDDYPAVSVSTVEFGSGRAPLYAGFSDLLTDDSARGRVPAAAGRVASNIGASGAAEEWQAEQDAEAVAGGDLIGVDELEAFPNDDAPFRRPATLAEVRARSSVEDLPPAALVGRPVSVDALSRWTFDVRYASGIELLVNTRARRAGHASVLKELLEESRYISGYADGRRLAYEVTTLGGRVVGVARPGTISCSCEDGSEVHVPAQVFWRDGAATYHLYARRQTVTTAALTAVATRMLAGPPVATQPGKHSPWWLAVVLSAALVTLALLLIRRAARPMPARE